jgi:hypothetical protein
MTFPNTAGVYAIRHADGREYIGSSLNIAARIRAHKSDLRRHTHNNERLQNSWTAHGEAAFTFVVLELCHGEERLAREQALIAERGAYYNIAPVAGTTEGYKFTHQQRLNTTKARGIPTYVYDGVERTLAQIAELVGVPLQRLWRRIERQGLSLEEAIARTPAEARAVGRRKTWADPAKRRARAANISKALVGKPRLSVRKTYEYAGERLTIYDIAARTGAPVLRIQRRLSQGMAIEDVVKYAAFPSLRHVPELAEKYADIARENVKNRTPPVMSAEGRARQRAAVAEYNRTREITADTKRRMSAAKRKGATRYDVLGEHLSIIEMSERWGVERSVIYHRIRTGWPVERAATEPSRKYKDSTCHQ